MALKLVLDDSFIVESRVRLIVSVTSVLLIAGADVYESLGNFLII